MNRLLFGDNLKWLRFVCHPELVEGSLCPDGQPRIRFEASIDLVYLDPPFNPNANYNVLFKETSGEGSRETIPCRFETRRTVPHLIPAFGLSTYR